MVYSIPNNFWQNDFCNDPLATYFGLSRTLLKLAEYATDMEVIVRQVIWAVSCKFWINAVFERLIMARIGYSW